MISGRVFASAILRKRATIDAVLNMAPADQKTEVVLPAEVLEEMPLPSDRKVTFLGGLFVLALLAAAYVASEIVLPLVFAITLKLLLQPALRAVERLHVPRTIAALFLILTLFGTIVRYVTEHLPLTREAADARAEIRKDSSRQTAV